MAGSDKRKQSLYFPEEMLKEIQEEATRQDRSLSWIVQKAWKLARTEIAKYPSVNDLDGGEEDEQHKIPLGRVTKQELGPPLADNRIIGGPLKDAGLPLVLKQLDKADEASAVNGIHRLQQCLRQTCPGVLFRLV